MGLFSRSKQQPYAGTTQLIPGHLIDRLDDVGRAVSRGTPPYPDVADYYLPAFLAAGAPSPGTPGWESFTEKWVAELNEASSQLGGWASAGAFHVAKDFVGSDGWTKEPLAGLMDRALKFLIDSGVEGSSIPMFAQQRWVELRQT